MSGEEHKGAKPLAGRRIEDRFIEAVESLRDTLREEHQQNREDMRLAQIELRRLAQEVTKIAKGFPMEDPESHRRYHESVIEWRETRNKMIKQCLIKAGEAGTLGCVGWILYSLWVAFKMEVLK